MAPRRHNTQTARDRQRLLADFERRLRYGEERGDFRHWLRHGGSIGWVVHPLADETDLLAELGISADDCCLADAYWRYGERVCFLQLYGSGQFRDPGVYYRFDRQYRRDVFDVCLTTPTVSSADFRRAIDVLERLVDSATIEAERAGLMDCGERWSCREERLCSLDSEDA